MAEDAERKIVLRAERRGPDSRYLWAYLDRDGNLHIDGQDLGPGTASVSSDGEYEWFTTIRSGHLPRLIALLGGDQGADVLDLLRERYTGDGSYELERLLRGGEVPVERYVWS